MVDFTESPLEVRIENTNHCNASCTMCPREKITRAEGFMSLELFKRLANECAAGGTKEMHLEGFGEPLLDKQIVEKIRYAKKVGIKKTLIVTNASLLNKHIAKQLLSSGLDKLKISFYGTNKEEYEQVHRGLSYDKVRENIMRLLELRRQLGDSTLKVSIKYIGQMRKFPKFACQWGTQAKVQFSRFHNYSYGRKYIKVKNKRKRVCAMVANPIMQILWDGRVVPCCYDFNGVIILGDVNHNSMREVWNSPQYKQFRRLHREYEFDRLPLCKSCDKLR